MAKIPYQPTSSGGEDCKVGVGPVLRGASQAQIEEVMPEPGVSISSLGSRMAKLREGQKITQGELAKRLGRSRATVNQYESGVIEPPLKMVGKLAEALAVDPALLAFGETPSSSPSGVRLYASNDGIKGYDYIDLSPGLFNKLRMKSSGGQLLELTSDAQTFGMRRGDFVLLDTSVNVLHGDGNLYVVRGGAGSLAVVKSDIQLMEQAEHVKLTFGQGQVSEVDPRKIEVVGLVKASLRLE